MINPVLAPAQWAQMEFALVQLGDQRRTQRLVKLATRLAESPGGTLPQALPHWEELKAAYRFFSRPENTHEQILRPHCERTLAACLEPGEYLLIEDTTLLDYSPHQATTGLGFIGNGGLGLCLHSTLAMKVMAWDLAQRPEAVVVGLLGQQCWAQTHRPAGETRGSRLWRNTRSSKRWAEVLKSMPSPPAGNTWTYVADREADFYEPIQRCQQRGVDFVIRACQNRRLAEGVGRLWDRLPQATVLGLVELDLRARPGAAARRARLQLSCQTACFSGPWRPGGWEEDLAELQVLEVKEIEASAGVEPLRWILLTSLACSSLTQARRIVGRYTARWHIEEYHKALKSGAGIEDSQLKQAHRLESLIAVLSLVAIRLLNTKLLAAACPDQPLQPEEVGGEALQILANRLGVPKAGWTQSTFWLAVARLGGFIGRKGDGSPGWQNIWRGWQRLIWMTEGLDSFIQLQKRCG
jgi:transposase-like protein/DDE family transposase/transposase Tn5 family protein